MPAEALAAIVYFRREGVLYQHTIDPREVDSIYLQTAALERFLLGGAAAAGAGASSTSTSTGSAGGGPRRPSPPHHATLDELIEWASGRRPVRPSSGSQPLQQPLPPPCLPLSIMVVEDVNDVPMPARNLLEQPPRADSTGGCIHCTGCGSWCPD